MIKLIPFVLASFILCSCGLHLYPLKGQYAKNATAIRDYPSEKRDELWGRIMTFFANNDIAIKTIDKSAGFIKSDRLDFRRYAWSEEVKHLKMDSSNKYVVTVRISPEPGDPPLMPTLITGAIKIYTIDSTGKILIRVSIDDLASNDYRYLNVSTDRYSNISYFEIHSLGKLERNIADYLVGVAEMPKCIFTIPKGQATYLPNTVNK